VTALLARRLIPRRYLAALGCRPSPLRALGRRLSTLRRWLPTLRVVSLA
jgi:hypothetical protein